MHAETVGALRRDAIGLRDVLFPNVTAMAPAAAVAASIPSGAAVAGGSLPLSVLITLVACLYTASCVAEPALTDPVSYAGPVVGAWLAAGAVVLLVLIRRHPGRMAETARVHLDACATGAERQDGTGVRRPPSHR
jgi:hypothetical protein